jgi:hypothetical protein
MTDSERVPQIGETMKTITILVVIGLLLLPTGCEQRERVPFWVRECVKEAHCDVSLTLMKIDSGYADANAAVACLRRLMDAKQFGNTYPVPGEHGFLYPVDLWMSGLPAPDITAFEDAVYQRKTTCP